MARASGLVIPEEKQGKLSSTPCAQKGNSSPISFPLYKTVSPLSLSSHLLWVVKAAGLSFYTLPEDPIIVHTGGLPKRPLFFIFMNAAFTWEQPY